MLDRGDFRPAAVQLRRDQGVQLFGLGHAAVEQCVEMRQIAFVETAQVAREGVNRGGIVLADQVLVECLHGEFACQTARRLAAFAARLAGRLGRFLLRLLRLQ